MKEISNGCSPTLFQDRRGLVLRRLRHPSADARLRLLEQEGQVISDFGIGPWRKASEEFVDGFQEVYHLSQSRVSGEASALL